MKKISKSTLEKAFRLMATAKSMTEWYEENFKVVSKYVHATSRGHEAIQLAAALQLENFDYAYPYYRDDAMLLGVGMQPYDLMLQLLAKKDDPFSGGRTYYAHPSLKDEDKPKIPHQSSATGMQAIPATGVALGFHYREGGDLFDNERIEEGSKNEGSFSTYDSSVHSEDSRLRGNAPIVICSLGDASVTEGEVAEAFQMAVLKKLPILYLVQDNEWDISANAEETRAQNAREYAKGFKGLEAVTIDGTDFEESYNTLNDVI